MKKVIIIAIILIVTIGAIVGAIITEQNNKKEKDLRNEILEINRLMTKDQIDDKKINELLDRTVSEGEYAKVEQATKKYFKDSIKCINEWSEMTKDKKIETMLTIDNYKADGPNFKKSLAYLSSYKSKLETISKTLLWFYDKEKINNYINEQNLEEDKKALLKEFLVDEATIDDEYKLIQESVDMVNKLIDQEEKVLVFLKDNQNNWRITKNKLMFTTDKLLKQYNKLTDKE